jgi:hypothetical protein
MRAAILALWMLTSCAPGARSVRDARGALTTWRGQLGYESRHETPTGTSDAIEIRPARSVDLAILDAAGAVIAEGRTDDAGRFAVEAPSGARVLRAFARVRVRGHDAAITEDPIGRTTHSLDAPLGDPAVEMRLVALDRDGDAGAFHIVDSMLRGLDAVQEWTGRTLPPVFAYWVRGGTREWSYYRGERPEGSGRFALELLGGDPGQQSVSDTDEHDEAIVLHELGHFVMDRLSGDSSPGGMHPRGHRIDPGLAWEEGRASWFALAVLARPVYRDTIGLEPWGSLRVDEDLEIEADPFPGLSSETSVSKVLWDLSDGAPHPLPDRDEDGIAIGPAAVLAAMIAHARDEGAYASLPSFLRSIVDRGVVAPAELASMLQRTNEPPELLPGEGATPWPRALSLGIDASDKIDGVTQPAPSGGRNLPNTGFDAIHTYRIRVDEGGMLLVRLDIVGSGGERDRTDLELELLDLGSDVIAASRGTQAQESLAHLVQPGFYIVRVRDSGRGNRADYRLHASIEAMTAQRAVP